jgi:5-methylcytosine-specific restriction endonuclease McrA
MSKPISDRARLLVFQKYEGRCAYCGCEITYHRFQVDHIHPKSGYIETENGNPISPNRIENLNPSCKSCNHYKHFYSVEEFRSALKKMLFIKQEYLFKSMTKFDIAKKYGCIKIGEWDGLFYYERIKQ